jgi:hypothetical protein
MPDTLARAACCVTALFWSLATTGVAAPITYFFSATGSGTIGGTTFTNATYVIALSGDTNAIDYTWQNLAEWRNAVKGTIQIQGLRKATIAEPILITTACGTAHGYIGIERAPGGAPFAAYIFNTQGVSDVDCVLGPAPLVTGLTATVSAFANVQSTKGPITLTSSSLITYQALTCSTAKARACRKQSVKFARTLLHIWRD